ncbi:MAG TPA: crosslink repair DNA glycosylase YcaQ family protein [Casimicrobiaceae bacterium]|nr:crosslink repair DNA glycosylase YcaQ family protein [Casimicrobiaceae bacterium]
MSLGLPQLRRYAVARSLFPPTTLEAAFERLAFVQADPIRAPARAQDLILRPRVKGYRAGDLERRYADVGVHEDVFVNYGFVTDRLHALMHPRSNFSRWSPTRRARAQAVLDFVRERGVVHPREVDAHFAHGAVTNYWGGSSNATTQLLDDMHYRGLLRVVRRSAGVRTYASYEHAVQNVDAAGRRERLDALVDVVVRLYAPLPSTTLLHLVRRLRYAAPQWRRELTAAIARARDRLAHARVDGTVWCWPRVENAERAVVKHAVRLLAPFDPVVWDRRRFDLFWNWTYRFEAYTPVAKRKLGYYALPLLWRDDVIGWGNLTVRNGMLDADIGYCAGAAPTDPIFRRELDAELDRMRMFLGLEVSG